MDRLVFLRRGVAEFARQRAPAPQPGQFGRRCAAPPVRHSDTSADLENETNRLCQVRSGILLRLLLASGGRLSCSSIFIVVMILKLSSLRKVLLMAAVQVGESGHREGRD